MSRTTAWVHVQDRFASDYATTSSAVAAVAEVNHIYRAEQQPQHVSTPGRHVFADYPEVVPHGDLEVVPDDGPEVFSPEPAEPHDPKALLSRSFIAGRAAPGPGDTPGGESEMSSGWWPTNGMYDGRGSGMQDVNQDVVPVQQELPAILEAGPGSPEVDAATVVAATERSTTMSPVSLIQKPATVGTVGIRTSRWPTGGGETEKKPIPWYRRRLWWLVGLVAVLAIGLAVGLGVGLVIKNGHDASTKNEEPASSEDTKTPTLSAPSPTSTDKPTDTSTFSPANPTSFVRDFHSVCPNSICYETLAAQSLGGKLHVFARGSDNNTQTRAWGGIDAGWESSKWQSIQGGSGSVIGPPSAIVWTTDGDERIDVFTVEDSGKSLMSTHVASDDSVATWDSYNIPMQARSTLCKGSDDRIDVFVVDGDDHKIKHNWWDAGADSLNLTTWSGAIGSQTVASGVAVACRNSTYKHDVVVYDRGDWSVRFNSRVGDADDSAANYTGWTSRGGEFMGDPVVVSFDTDPDRFDFFGVGSDRKLYHFYRTSPDAEATELESLGSSLASVPSVTSPAKGVLDLIATRTDGRVVHYRFDGEKWDEIWEDIGISSNSAPLAVNGPNGRTTLMILGQDGELLVAEWDTAADADWKDLAWNSWSSGGGKFATDFSGLYSE